MGGKLMVIWGEWPSDKQEIKSPSECLTKIWNMKVIFKFLTVVLLLDAHIELWRHECLAVFDQDAAKVASKLSSWLGFFNWKKS